MKSEARKSALMFMAQAIRAVLRETASEALQRLLMERFKKIKINKRCHEDEEAQEISVSQNMELEEMTISPCDIDYCYAVVTRLGEKWRDTLSNANEKDAASVVRHVLNRGRFLEEDVIDEFPMPRTDLHIATTSLMNRQNHGDRYMGNNVSSIQSESNQLGVTNLENTSAIQEIPKPYEILYNLGWEWDLSQSMDEAFPSPDLKPTSTVWKALPSHDLTSSSSTIHIPKATILPVHEIKTQHPHQLYGYPSSSMKISFNRNNLVSNVSTADFYRDQINHLDDAFSTADEMNYPTSWYHGWDCIQRAVHKNRDRMYLETIAGRKRKYPKSIGFVDSEKDHHDIIPRSMITQNISSSQQNLDESTVTTSTITDGSTNALSLERNTVCSTDLTIVPIVKVISSNRRVAILLENKQNQQHTSLNKLHQEESRMTQCQERNPSSIFTLSWTIEDIQNEMSDRDEQNLIAVINQDKEEEFLKESTEFHRIEGALKPFGLIHLWEQKRSGFMKEEKGNLSNKKKGKIINKAKRMRLYPHTLEKQEKAAVKHPRSKVMWSESLIHQNVHGSKEKEEMDINNILNQYYMEFDLGEVKVYDSVTNTTMAFRSLEITALIE